MIVGRVVVVVVVVVAALVCGEAAARGKPRRASDTTVAAVAAAAPKARTPRRVAFARLGANDDVAAGERLTAYTEALELSDRAAEKSTRASLSLKAAALADAVGDTAAARRFFAIATDASGAKQNKAIVEWRAIDDVAHAVIDGLDGDGLDAALSSASPAAPSALSSSWSTTTERYRERVRAARARPPKGSSFAVRRALADAVVDERAGLDAALATGGGAARAAAAKTLHRRLQGLARGRGRETGRLRALALELDAVVWLADVAAGDAGTDGVAAAARALFAADRLREDDATVDKLDAAALRYAGRLRTRALCARVEAPDSRRRISCDDVEQKAFGDVSFVDASRLKKGPFVADEANATLADYDVLLERCMKAGAKAKLTTQSHVELEWGIDNGGRVRGLDLRPMRLRGTSVETCVTDALAQFRYRPYPGEMQHQRLDFEVGGEL